MKYEILNCEEAKRITGWSDVDQEYKGLIPGYLCGYNFEVTKNGVTDFASCKFSYNTPDDIMNNNEGYYVYFLEDYECVPTGRVIFRGYYTKEYDIDERESYVLRVQMQVNERGECDDEF